MNDIETYDSFFSLFAGVTPDDIVAYKKGGHVKKDKCGCKAKMLLGGGRPLKNKNKSRNINNDYTDNDDNYDMKKFLNGSLTREDIKNNKKLFEKENPNYKKPATKDNSSKKQQPQTKNQTKTPKK